MSRRRVTELYPKLFSYGDACLHFRSTRPLQGYKHSDYKPLSTGRRTLSAWRMKMEHDKVICLHGNHPVITYQRDGWVRISPSPASTTDVAVIRAVAPVDTVKWDYRKNCLVIRAEGKRYECGPEGVLIPPSARPTTYKPNVPDIPGLGE